MPSFAPTIIYPEGIYNSCGSASRKISNPKQDRLDKKAYQAYSPQAFPIGVHTPSSKSGNGAPKLPTTFDSSRVFSAPMETPSGKALRSRPRPTSRELDEPPSPTPVPKKLKLSLADKAEALLSPGRPNPRTLPKRMYTLPEPTPAEEGFEPKNLFKREPELNFASKATLTRPTTPPYRVPRPRLASAAAAIPRPSIISKANHYRPGTPDGGRFIQGVSKPLPGSPSTKKAYPGLGIGRPSHLAGARPGAR
jgi:hypothetical protein